MSVRVALKCSQLIYQCTEITNTWIFCQDQVQAEVKILLNLKVEYKNATGKDWKPGVTPVPVTAAAAPVLAAAPPNPASGNDATNLNAKITEQGNKIRQMKTDQAPMVLL